jgi:hypothetical protein
LAACTAVLETLRNDPTRQQLFDSFNYFSSNPAIIMHANFENYLQLYQEKTLEMVKKIFDRMVIKCVEDTMSRVMRPEQGE